MFDSGIHIILGLQQFSPAMDFFFKALTFLGNEIFFLISLPCVYWCLCKRTGARLSLLFLISAYINMVAKLMADMPRPFEYSDAVQQMVAASGGGFPSGHTQGAVVFWGYLACKFKNTLFRSIAGFLILGIPLSRVYLGVHFPIDIAGGYLLGSILLYAFIMSEKYFADLRQKIGFAGMLAAAGCLPAIGAILVFEDKTAVSAMAALAGMGTGFLLEYRYLGFAPPRNWCLKAGAFTLGMAVFAMGYVGLKILFAGLEPPALFRYIRYGLVGLWGGLGAPWLFLRLKWSLYESNS
jgi:membrane-associated phospholipid phosphatase